MNADLKLTLRTWLIVAGIAVWMLVWVGAAFMLIGDRAPPWNLGTNRPVPGDSFYTTGGVTTGQAGPAQVTLPEQKGTNP